MSTSLCSLTVLLFLVAADDSAKERAPHPFAPSLPELTEEEEAKFDLIIDNFIKFDTGKLKGAEGIKAAREFEALGPEAIFALIRGLHRAAEIEHSCPALIIAKKISKLLLASKDVDLLDFARQEIGAGVEASRHKGILGDLRVTINAHRNGLLKQGITSKSPKAMPTPQLIEAVGKEKGAKLRPLMLELSNRKGDDSIKAFTGVAESSNDKDMQQLARTLIATKLGGETPAKLRERSKDANAEVRLGAVTAIANKSLPLGDVLIERLGDKDDRVRELAHQTLVKWNKGTDYGPSPGASASEVEKAIQQWQSWWNSRKK